MCRSFALIGLLMFLYARAMCAGTIMVDFEGFPDSTAITTQYAGLTFSNATVIAAGVSLNEFEFPPHSGTNVAFDDGGPMTVFFANRVSSFSGYFTYSEPLTLTGLDALGNPVVTVPSASSNNEALSGLPGSVPNEFLELTYAAGLSEVILSGDPAGGSFVVDDLAVTTVSTTTPEPSSLALIGGSLVLGLLFVRRQGRSRRESVAKAFLATCCFLCFGGQADLSAATVQTPLATPPSILSGVSTQLTFTSQIQLAPNDHPILNVNLLQVFTNGSTSVIATMHDDGLNGDAVKGDGIYTSVVMLTESGLAPVQFRVSVALQGTLLRTLSPVFTLPVTGSGSSGTINVHVAELDITQPGNVGAGAGFGVQIVVDGIVVGQTDSNSNFTGTVAPGNHQLSALVPPAAAGLNSFTILAGQTEALTVLIDGDKETVQTASLSIDEASGNILPSTASTVTLRLKSNGLTLPLVTLGSVELYDSTGRFVSALDADFSIQADGSLRAMQSALATVFAAQLKGFSLDVTAATANGIVYGGNVQVFYGQFQVVGSLKAPPSSPMLSVSGISITLEVLQTPVQVVTTSDSQGNFTFPLLPAGDVQINAQAFASSKYYYGFAQFLFDAPETVTITMLNEVDVKAGVPGFTVSTIADPPRKLMTEASGFSPLEPRPRQGRDRAEQAPFDASLQLHKAALEHIDGNANSVTASAVAGAEGVPSTNYATLILPQGTDMLTLSYVVSSPEYPVYVDMQSIYNDVWSVSVLADNTGQQLFNFGMNVNSQLFIDPTWQPNGSTGNVVQQFNVQGLTASGPASVTVSVSATNIGDSVLSTSISGTLSLAPPVSINSITAEPVASAVGPGSITTRGNNASFSIPTAGQYNTWQRALDVQYTLPDATAQVTNVQVDLLDANSNSTLQTIVNEGPSALGPVQVIDFQTLRLFVTFMNTGSTVNSQPPPTDSTEYKLTLTATDGGLLTSSSPKYSSILQPLYNLPSTIPRFGARDQGGDGWSAQETYNWLVMNSPLITRVDDISGEHGRDIGHHTHTRGTDVDIFQFYTFAGAVSGTQNYSFLKQNVISAFQGNMTAQALVVSWANAMRAGLNTLAGTPGVSRLFTNYGDSLAFTVIQKGSNVPATLASGWAKQLLETGIISSVVGGVPGMLNFGIGTWGRTCGSGQTVTCDTTHVHENHVHITLSF